MNKKQFQKFPNTFANNFRVSKETYEQNNNIRFKSETSSTDSEAAQIAKALEQCPPPAKPTDEINNAAVKDAAKAMGIRSCKTSTSTATAGFCSVAILGCAAAQFTTTDNLGCETVQIIADKFRQTTQNISCIMNINIRTVDASMRSSNTVRYKAINGAKLKVKCPGGLKIEQSATIKYVDLQSISTEQIAEIANEAKTTATEIVKAVQKNEAGYAGTPIGSKFVSDSQKQIDSLDFKKNVKESIDQIKIRVNANNEVEFIADGAELEFEGNACEIKQNTLIDIMATKILNDSLTSVFKTKVESEVKKDVSATSENKSEGAPNVVGDMFKAIGGMMGMGMLVIVIIIIGLVMVIPSILKGLGGEEGKNIAANLSAIKTAGAKN
jgi:hypothetical protein